MSKVIPFMAVCTILSFMVYRFINSISIIRLCHLESRPVIYGEDFCSYVYHKKITLTSTFIERVVDLVSQKTVLHGIIDDKNIVLKNLVPPDDFPSIEESFHSKFNSKVLQSKKVIDILKIHINSVIKFKPGSTLNTKFRLCPYGGNIENLFRKINADAFLVQDYMHLWTILQSNPEPLILKILKPPEWPVPEFYGSCGHMIAVEDCGEILTEFYDTPWVVRANLTLQLINSVLDFTFKDPDFAYYLTDMSPDNIAVTHRGELKFIDFENVIVLDRNPFFEGGYMENWNFNHTTRHIPCKDCIVFSSDDICEHKISDHNIYAVCKEILWSSTLFPKGFLHDPPFVTSGYHKQFNQELKDLVTDCVEGFRKPRFQTAELLKAHINKFLGEGNAKGV